MKDYQNPKHVTDGTSSEILDLFHPAMATTYRPIKTIGDGNCLYRAVSTALSGEQGNHTYLRLITALELIMQVDFYSNNNFIGDSRIVTSEYSKLLHDAIQINTYSDMGHIYALSAAIGKPIKSYYPPQLHSEFSSEPHTRRVVGRAVIDQSTEIHIMWTQMSKLTSVNQFLPNHFVPLLELSCLRNSREDCKNDSDTVNLGNSSDIETDNIDSTDGSTNPNLKEMDASFSASTHCGENQCVNVEALSSVEQTFVENDSQGKLITGFMKTEMSVNLLKESQSGIDHIPAGKKENVYFIGNNTANISKRSINKHSCFTDDCGVWDSDSGATPISHYLVSKNGDLSMIFCKLGQYCFRKRVEKKLEYIPLNPQPEKSRVVTIHRYYTCLKLDKTYKKRVTWLKERPDVCIVEYVGLFPGLVAHGNSRLKPEYLRLPTDVMNDVDRMLPSHKPKVIRDTLGKKYDELKAPEATQIRDRKKYLATANRRQFGDKNRPRKNLSDHINLIENKVSQNHHFVRSVVRLSGKTPCVILYTDDQICDIKTMCAPGHTPLGIDKTFNLCDMHLTVPCFKQLSVNSTRTNEPPIFLGPIFIHDSSDFESFGHFLFHLRLKLGQTNLDSLVIGTDEEQALVKAIELAFPDSTHVLCTRHLKQNTRQKLADDAIGEADRNDILRRIFGDGGLIDAEDSICFEEQSESILRHCSAISERFTRYFNDKLKPMLMKKVNEPCRKDMIEQRWTNNNSESINHVLKQTMDWKAKPLVELVQTLEDLVLGQYKSLRSAIIGKGDFRLATSHDKFSTSITQWMSMTKDQRDRVYSRYRNHQIPTPGLQTSTDGQSTIPLPKAHGRKPGQRKRKVNERTNASTKKKRKD